MMAPRLAAAFLALMLVLAIGPAHAGDNPDDIANRIKVAYIFKFADYVDWPGAGQAQAAAPLLIGVLGADKLAEELKLASARHQIKNRQVQVRELKAGDSLAGLHILYVGQMASGRGRSLLEHAATQAILTIGDAPDMLATGTILNFVLVDDRVRFEVSLARAEASGLKISSRLLSVAYRIEGKAP